MAKITEATMQETLRRWLEQQGHSVYSEVSIGAGDIDLYTESPEGETWGIEIKNHWDLIEWDNVPDGRITAADATEISEGKLRKIVEKQLIPYVNAKAVDKLFLATQNPNPLVEEFDRDRRVPLTNSMADPLGLNDRQDIPDGIGFIKVPPYPPELPTHNLPVSGRPFCDHGIKPEITCMAAERPVTSQPSLPEAASPEAQFTYSLWTQMAEDTVILREAPIPNPHGEQVKRVDLLYFYGDHRPWKIYEKDDPENYGICGVEVKTDLSQPAVVRGQLREYLESGGLTELYLAIPPTLVEDAVPICEDLGNDIGLISVATNGMYFRPLEPPTSFSLAYDGIRWKDGTRNVASVGWGKAYLKKADSMHSIFDQT